MGGKTGKALLGLALIGASFLIPGLGLGAYLTSALTGALIAQGSGLLLQAFFGQSLDNRQQGIEINSANTLAPLPVIYGKTRVGLRLVDMRVAGKNLYIVGALCHGSEDGSGIAGIDEIYFNDKLAFDAAGTAIEGVAKRTENLPNQPGPGTTPTVVSLGVVTKYLGTDAQTADPSMTGGFPNDWKADCRGRGVAYIVLKLQWHEKLYPMNIPNVVVVVRGNKVYDPRSATTGYSTNPALHARDYLRSTRYGVGASASEVDDAAIQAMANHCDELVTVPGQYTYSGFRTVLAATAATPCEVTTDTNHGYSTGNRVSINSGFDTGLTGLIGEWTITVTAANKFTLNGSATTGTYSASSAGVVPMVQQKRFESNGWLDISRDPRDNLSDLLTACRGNMVYTGGVYSLFIRRVMSPVTVVALTEDNMLDFTFSDQGIKDAPNLARVKFINPLNGYAPDEVQWPRVGVTNTLLTEDGGFESAADLNLPFTQDRTMAQQIGMVTVRESRGALVCECVTNEQGLLLAVGDVVPVSHSTPGWSAKPFWVMGTSIVGSHSVKLTLLEYTSGAYSLDEQQLTVGSPDTNLPDPTLSGPPTSVAGSNSSVTGTDGSVVNTITLTWVAPTSTASPNLDHYQIRYKQDFESEWRPAPDPKLTDLQAVFPGVGVGTWYIQIRAINSLSVSSDWVQATVVVAGGGGTGGTTPATVTGFAAAFVGGNIEAKWNANTEVDLAGYEVREGGANWGASTFLAKVDATKFTLLRQYVTKRSYTLRIKPFTRSGTYSATDATVAVSQAVPDATAVSGGDITVESKLGKIKVTVDLTGTGATQARLYASTTNGFTPGASSRQTQAQGLINSDKVVFEFILPVGMLAATVYMKIGLKDELSDQLAEAEQYTSQFTVTGRKTIFNDLLRVDGGAAGDAIVQQLTDIGELTRAQRLEGQIRTLVQGMDSYIPNAGFEVWESASQPHAWQVNTTGGAVAAKETTIKFSGDCSLKYTLPASAGWQGINTNDPTVGVFCVPLRPGRTYKFRIASRASRVAEGQKYRLVVGDGVYSNSREWTYAVIDTWQTNDFIVTVPNTALPNSRIYVEFNQNGYAGGSINCYVDQVEIEEMETQDVFDNGSTISDAVIDWSYGTSQKIETVTLGIKKLSMTNPVPGMPLMITIKVSNGNGYVWDDANILWENGTMPTPTQVVSHYDTYVFQYDENISKYRCLIAAIDYSDYDVQVQVGRLRAGPNLNDLVTVQTNFKAKAILFFHNDLTGSGTADRYGTANDLGWGFATNSAQYCVGAHVQNGAGTSNVNSHQRTDAIAATVDDANAIDGLAAVNAINDWSFEIKTTDAFPANKNPWINFIAIGGKTVNAKVGAFTTTSGTGNKAVTGVGFTPKAVFLMGIGATVSTSTVLTAMCPWFACGKGSEGVCYSLFSVDNVGTDDAQSGWSNGSNLVVVHKTNAAAISLASMSSLDSDGFTINFSANNIGTAGMFYLALSGLNVHLGSKSVTPEDDEAFLDVGFSQYPLGVLLMYNKFLTADAGNWKDHGHIGFGVTARVPQTTAEWGMSAYNNDSPASGNSELRQAKSAANALYQLATSTTASITEQGSTKRWEREGPVLDLKAVGQQFTISHIFIGS